MSRFTRNPEAVQQKQAEALQLLEQGISELSQSENWLEYLKVQSRFHRYSYNNCLLIRQQCPDATQIAGYQTWKSLGRQVRKGETGIRILAPVSRKVEDEETGEVGRVLAGFRTTAVFDVSQTDGDSLPEICTRFEGEDAGLYERLKTYAQQLSLPVEDDAPLQGKQGFCAFVNQQPVRIGIDSRLSLLQKAKTLAHELAHALLHTPQEYRRHSQKSQAELEAESTAFVVLHHFGLDSGEYSFAYVTGWSGGGEEARAQLQKSARAIQETAHKIIESVSALVEESELQPLPLAA